MEEQRLIDLLEKFPEMKFEKIEHRILFDDPEDEEFHYNIGGFKGNPEMLFTIGTDERISILEEILKIDLEFIPEFLAIKKTDVIEVAYKPIGSRSSFSLRRRLNRGEFTSILDYFSNKLEIS